MIRWLLLLLIAGLAHGQACFIKDPATADSLGASATVINVGAVLTRANSAYDPNSDTIAGASVLRTKNVVIGTTTYAMGLFEGSRTCLLAAGTSSRFDRWTAANGLTVTADTTAAPNGEVIAQTLTDPGASLSSARQTFTVGNDSQQHVFGIYVLKTAGGTAPTFGVTLALTGGTGVTTNARINTDTGAQQYGSNANTQIETSSAGTWYRVLVYVANNTTGNTTLTLDVYPAASAYGASVDDATTTGTAICCFSDLTKLANTILNPVLAPAHNDCRNLLAQSETLNTAWTKTRITVTSDSTANPLTGIVNADTIVEDATAANTHVLSQSFTKSAAAAQTFTFSTYLKQSGRTWALVECNSTVSSILGAGIYFDVANGVKGTAVTTAGWTLTSSNITAVGSWYRCDITVVTDTNAVIIPQIYSATGDVLAIHNGNSAAALICWGNQLVYGLKPQAYWATTTAGLKGADALLSTYVLGQTGTMMSVVRPYNWSADQGNNGYGIWYANDTGNSGQYRANGTSIYASRSDAGGQERPFPPHGLTNGVNRSIGMTWDATAITAFIAGAAISTDTTLTPPYDTNTSINIGAGNLTNFGGWAVVFGVATVWPRSSMQIFANGVVP